ncbi:AMP-binding protein [Desulfobacula sp.]|uniref:class I adenylate-forming enzyme family protein n=1 Tax=Desulfobacula sp. TaxID=2593537 RepID=UPI00261381C4|nr:AMP-binding protein [Desulfobacula sp.]
MIKSMNIAWCVQRWAELHPNKSAIIFEEQTISYKELLDRVERTSYWLLTIGIEKGDRVAVMLNNCPEFMELFLACSKIGAIFTPLNYRIASVELDYFLKDCRPRLFIYGSAFQEAVESIDFEIYLPPISRFAIGEHMGDNSRDDYRAAVSDFEGKKDMPKGFIGPTSPEEPQVIMYTSGTTGRPKGAVLTHMKTFFNCLNADMFFELQFSDKMLIALPLFHSGGLFIQAAPVLFKGATIILHRKFQPLKIYNDIEKYNITKFLGVPTVYKELLTIPPEERTDISSLKVCAGGGEKLTKDLIEQCTDAGLAFRQILGQTETSILLWSSEKDALKKPGTVGRPVFHAQVSILDKDGKTAKQGEIGEIVVQGSTMMKEYWQDPVKTEQTIKNGYLHTGDLAWMDEDGFFYLAGRAGDMYISGGENVYPIEVEKTLKTHPDIEEVAVIGIPDEKWGESGHAFIIKKPTASLGQEDVINFCHGKLSKYKWPQKVTFMTDFPRTTTGKVKKKELEENNI